MIGASHISQLSQQDVFDAVSAPKRLIVLLHAYRGRPQSMQQLAKEVRTAYPDGDILIPQLPFSLFSLARPNAVAKQIVSQIDSLDHDRYKEIILVGHSMGAIIARAVWVNAYGVSDQAEVPQRPTHQWAPRISRIVLMAALNRGWMLSSALSPLNRLLWSIGLAWGNA